MKKSVWIKIAHEVAIKKFEKDDVEGVKNFIAEFIAEWLPLFPFATIRVEQNPCGDEPISGKKKKFVLKSKVLQILPFIGKEMSANWNEAVKTPNEAIQFDSYEQAKEYAKKKKILRNVEIVEVEL